MVRSILHLAGMLQDPHTKLTNRLIELYDTPDGLDLAYNILHASQLGTEWS